MVSIDDFKEVRECDYKNEHYSVRDNGAMLRRVSFLKRYSWTYYRFTYFFIVSYIIRFII